MFGSVLVSLLHEQEVDFVSDARVCPKNKQDGVKL